jgi:tetratricopeptide (TPR) repeat protein
MSQETSVQPNLNDLFASYLERQADAQAAGIASFDGEVTPYEVGPVQPLDPKMAWDEALAVLPMVGKVAMQRRKAPPHWAQLVAAHESIFAIACSAGNFPQLMRNFHAILTQPNLADMRPIPSEARSVSAELVPWAEEVAQGHKFPDMLLALGTLRLAKQFADAERFITKHEASIPAEWRNGWDNEKAALAWHSGRYDEARQAWDQLEPTPPVLFNRGMAALFANDPTNAKLHLNDALAQMPAASAWHHLGRLYLILADLRRS